MSWIKILSRIKIYSKVAFCGCYFQVAIQCRLLSDWSTARGENDSRSSCGPRGPWRLGVWDVAGWQTEAWFQKDLVVYSLEVQPPFTWCYWSFFLNPACFGYGFIIIQKKLMRFFKDVLVTSKVYIYNYIYILAGVICVTNEAAEVGRDDTGSSLTLAFNTLKNT